MDWSLFDQALEFRDGFLIVWKTDSLWIPKHALTDAFTAADLAGLLRAKLKKYRVIDRPVGLPETSKSNPDQA